ncbi:hypothetical protein [Myroides guanonis]|uniref:Lipoprotein n=1 Tax=Myroides guanonis TaxID=1150112 RepID=A0A1I3TZ37_9FLAO|nr:hypothetical protein [Myroides guanonis]SFJ76558.1 hypothetical protein SAMN04487893_11576 [Myroides guanonis]
MKYKVVIYCLIALLFFGCLSTSKYVLDNDAKNKIEKLLSIHKEYAFIDLYEKSIVQEEKKFKIQNGDSLFDITSMELYQEFCLIVDFYSKDHPTYENIKYDKLIHKWLQKEYPPYISMDNPNIKTTMTFRRAFDFYNSKDLNEYIDSLRVLFYAKYRNNELKSLECSEARFKIWDNERRDLESRNLLNSSNSRLSPPE